MSAPKKPGNVGLWTRLAGAIRFGVLSLTDQPRTEHFADVCEERAAQDHKWGAQSHPDVPWELPERGFDERFVAQELERAAKGDCDREFAAGRGTWWHIANEELAEVLAAPPEKRREELVQLTAVCMAWLEDMDNKAAAAAEKALRESCTEGRTPLFQARLDPETGLPDADGFKAVPQ